MKRDSGSFAASSGASGSIEGYDDGTRGEVARYLAAGQTHAAVNRLEEFVLRTGRDEEAVTDLAVLYHLTQRAPAARELLRTLIEVRPESHLARKQLSLIELLSGNAEVAFAIIEPTLQARPDDAEALKIVGDIASALKLFERARAFYTKALSVNPADEETHRRLHQLPLAKPSRETAPRIDLRPIFEEHAHAYALLRPMPQLPDYLPGQTIELLCAELDSMREHVRAVLRREEARGLHLEESRLSDRVRLELRDPHQAEFHLRVELFDALPHISAELALAVRLRVMQRGMPLCSLAGEARLAAAAAHGDGAECLVFWGEELLRARDRLAAIRESKELRIVAIYQRRISSVSQLIARLPTEALAPEQETSDVMLVIAARRSGSGPAAPEAASNGPGFFHAKSEAACERTLEAFNLPPLGHYLREPNPSILAPYHLEPFKQLAIHQVSIDELRANLMGGKLAIPIQATPHYQYVLGNRAPYIGYHARYAGRQLPDDHFPEAFDRQIASYDPTTDAIGERKSHILAVRLAQGGFLIIDGLHRAAILAARGVSRLTIAEPGYL
jgi:tetratricopeptide (TPR) repeat protein